MEPTISWITDIMEILVKNLCEESDLDIKGF